jgi:hypothetical protein
MYLAHIGGGLNLSEVGRLFGRDRTTVAHACSLIEDARDDERFDRMLDLLERSMHWQLLRSDLPTGKCGGERNA